MVSHDGAATGEADYQKSVIDLTASTVDSAVPAVRVHSVEPKRRGNLLFVGAAGLVVLGVLFQNFYRISRTPLFFDERTYVTNGWKYLHWWSLPISERSSRANNFEHPPLAKLIFGFAQVLSGHLSYSAARIAGAICVVLAGVILACWLAKEINRWAGLLAFGIFGLIPMSVVPQVTRFSRSVILDSVAELFMVASVVVGWYWFRSTGKRGWLFAGFSGALAGFAAASKENGFLGLVGIVLLGLFWNRKSFQELAIRSGQTIFAAAGAGFAFLLTYLPFEDPIGRIKYLLDYQSGHSADGHLVGLPGFVTMHPPWWANFYWASQGFGTFLSWTLLLSAVAAIVIRRDRLVAWCLAALAAPILFHCFYAGVALPFYWAMWTPMFLVLAALGIWQLGTLAIRSGPIVQRYAAGLIGAAISVVVLIGIGGQLLEVAKLQQVGAGAVAPIREKLGLHKAILTTGTYSPEIEPLLPGAKIITKLPSNLDDIDTVLIGQPRCRTRVSAQVRALVESNLRTGSLRLAHSDRLLKAYVPTAALHAPTKDEIKAQPGRHLFDNC